MVFSKIFDLFVSMDMNNESLWTLLSLWSRSMDLRVSRIRLEVSGLPCLYGKIEELFVLVVSGIKIWREFHNIYDHCMMLSQMNYTIGMRMMMVKTIKSSLSSWIIVSLFKSLSSLCVAQLILSPIFAFQKIVILKEIKT